MLHIHRNSQSVKTFGFAMLVIYFRSGDLRWVWVVVKQSLPVEISYIIEH